MVSVEMTEIDIWSDDDPTETSFTQEVSVGFPEVSENQIVLEIHEDEIRLFSKSYLEDEFESLYGFELILTKGETHYYTAKNTPLNAFVLRYALRGRNPKISPADVQELGSKADSVPLPRATLTEDGRHVQVTMPNIRFYREMLSKVNAYPTKDGYRVDLTRVLDLEAISVSSDAKFPRIAFAKSVLQLNREPIPGYDGTVESLKKISVSELNIVTANKQSWKALKSSKKTLKDKMDEFGISTLHDLLFWLPRRYIDKSKPQDLSNLLEGETAVVLGNIESVSELGSGRGAVFNIKTSTGKVIRATFFNQRWLVSKFKVGTQVLVTGKFSLWNKTPQVSGASIEHAEEAAVLPIVPVYNQSISKGITTYFIMAASRELISRLGDIKLPEYFKKQGKMTYFEALTALHFPNSLAEHATAIETLAFYELVYMQIIIQETKEKTASHTGIEIQEGSRKLQAKGIKSLPFSLTKSQKKAIVELNSKMADSRPSSTLLSADVGAGKTAIAQMASLRAVDAGYQAVVLSPTEILARQLLRSFEKVADDLSQLGEKVNVAFLSSTLKAKEKREVLAKIKSGEADIIVGTHSLMGTSVEYKNLGFIAIDEQQKFGAEQRTQLLNSRSDGKVPDILMQTATPIPRSTAQVFYGDIDMIELKEKPPGRIPIVTEWLQEDPLDVIEQATSEMWVDVINEAKAGNQAFIIAPLVTESDKIDSASVERTYKSLTKMALSGLKVGFVHGQMKSDEQQECMKDFRDKKYDVLVASTVVEVGVDIPDATRVIILSADRMGSASLHQIRGRVGRNSKPSKCYLVSLGKTDNAQLRLQSLVDSNDGFEIAQKDLDIRGEGTLFSTEQSGRSEMVFANLSKHREKIEEAKKEALRILGSKYREQAIKDSKDKFESNERMM